MNIEIPGARLDCVRAGEQGGTARLGNEREYGVVGQRRIALKIDAGAETRQ